MSETHRIENLFTPAARAAMRAEIEAVRGAEVFFVGRLDARMVIEEVEAVAFGNRHSVPAITRFARPGDVIVHNHPSGNLEPSQADLDIFAQVGDKGIGAYIVNNDATEARVVVKAMREDAASALDEDGLAASLGPGGALAARLDRYEHRPQQLEMLKAVSRAFNREGIAVVEAGTGTGKSFAYLLPALQWSVRNGEKVVVSTHTINLQEQLVEKDLPALRNATGLEFDAALVKGRGNYLCKRKADYLRHNPSFADVGEKRVQIDAILEWTKTTQDGSLSDLGFQPDSDVWEQVVSESDNCLRVQCPHYQGCFFYNSRRRAARAQVLVVNHHLLMSDLAVRAESENYTQTAVLPPFHRLILDEAHHLEDVATGGFGGRVSRQGILWTLRRLASLRTGEGLFRFLSNKIHEGLYPLSPDEARTWMTKLAIDMADAHRAMIGEIDEATERTAMALDEAEGGAIDQAGEFRRRLDRAFLESANWRQEIEPSLRSVIVAGRKLIEELRALFEDLYDTVERETPETMSPLLELRSTALKLERQLKEVVRFLGGDPGECRWIEYRRRAGARRALVSFCSAPLDVAEGIREKMLRRFKTVVLTSATLTVENRFDYFMGQIGARDPARLTMTGASTVLGDAGRGGPAGAPGGANGAANAAKGKGPTDAGARAAIHPAGRARHLETLRLDTPFDYDRQVYVGVPTDLPSPKEDGFAFGLSEFLRSALLSSRGRAFVLFTSYATLERVHRQVAPELEAAGYPCLRQGTTTRALLTETFKRDIGSVLFATSSFWEGVDVPGEALSCLILTRLPFQAPGDPLQEARIEELRARGVDPFDAFIVPRAVIKFRQGFGRLIRTAEDRGAVLVCDKRVVSQGYGRKFLGSLPTKRVDASPARTVLERLEGFFEK